MRSGPDHNLTDFYPCAACGFLVLSKPPGSYEKCRICGWEDDGLQLANPSSGGGANERSLTESQMQLIEDFPPDVRIAQDGSPRDVNWRPLHSLEIQQHQEEVSLARTPWTREGIDDPASCYWRRFFICLGSPEHGWMEIAICDDGKHLTFDASHVPSDSIEELVKALTAVLDGHISATVDWYLEPPIYEFLFEKSNDGNLIFSVIDKTYHAKTLLEIKRSAVEIIFPFIYALNFLHKLNLEGQYCGKNLWNHNFPVEDFLQLKQKTERSLGSGREFSKIGTL